MTEFIENFFSSVFGDNVVLATILIAIVPIIELKGAIPFAMSTDIWGVFALSEFRALLFSLIGSCLIVPILALIYKPLIEFLKKTKLFKNLASKFESKVNSKKENIEEKIGKKNKRNFIIKLFSVFIFVALPLPLTGVWTGTCLAVALGLSFFWTYTVVILGNVCAGLIITFISHFFGANSIIFFYIILILIIVVLITTLIINCIKSKKNSQNR